MTVVGDADEAHAAVLEVDRDPARAGVERVLDELLHDRRRALDDLAGGDLHRERLRKDLHPPRRRRGSPALAGSDDDTGGRHRRGPQATALPAQDTAFTA